MRTAALACLWVSAASAASPLTFSSGPARVALVELYTSEGCSSCPPAEEWLGSLIGRPGLWKDFVPVEFHVVYWDGLGWRDRLASREFTARQYAYAAAWHAGNVYTPCFVRNGAEWRRDWGNGGAEGADAGLLRLEVGADGGCRVRFLPAGGERRTGPGPFDLHLAVLGGGISSRVTAGENRGATLTHEFVVLGLSEKPLAQDPSGPLLGADLALPGAPGAGQSRRAVAAWVTRHGELDPLQAVGGWLPEASRDSGLAPR